jgi:hypothetical protein
VPSLAKTKEFYNTHFPSLTFAHEEKNTDQCLSASVSIESYTQEGFFIETRFVENQEIRTPSSPSSTLSSSTSSLSSTSNSRQLSGGKGKPRRYSIPEFVAYVESVHEDNTGPNHGWDAFYDRHIGLMFERCSLDVYMNQFFKEDVSFNPHGRPDAGTTDNSNSAKEHVWTEGTQGYGIEMQGFYDYTFRDCYTVFNWCTETTDGEQVCASSSESSS